MYNSEFSLDIIIPTVNRNKLIFPLVQNLIKQIGKKDNIIIVWQGKEAPSIPDNSSVKLIHYHKNSLPGARNFGIKHSTNELLLFLDDDVKILPNLISNHKKSHKKNNVGAVAGFIYDPVFDPSTITSFDEHTGECIQNFSNSKSDFTISLMGANMSFKKVALKNINYFDEKYIGNALWEDVDCAFRIRNQGYKIWFESNAKVIHQKETSGGCRNSNKIIYLYQQFHNTAYFACKFAPPQYYSSWIRFWKYRLEYLTRTNSKFKKHSIILVLAGITGAVIGILRYVIFNKIISNQHSKIDL